MISQSKRSPRRMRTLCPSEVMTIVILFHLIGYRNFKQFYLGYVIPHLSSYFPGLPSYTRFVEIKKEVVFPLYCFLSSDFSQATGISFIDSTPLTVCHNRRIHSHKVFKKIAKRGHSSTGWFFGFKLHLIVSDQGALLSFALTPGNVNDRVPVTYLVEGKIQGKLFGDKVYLSQQLFSQLLGKGIQLITKIKKNMKNRLMSVYDKVMLRKRAIIETIFDQLKNISQIEHSRHRSPTNFLVNLIAGLTVYSLREKKPSINVAELPIKCLTM